MAGAKGVAPRTRNGYAAKSDFKISSQLQNQLVSICSKTMTARVVIIAALFLCAVAAAPTFDAMIAINYANPISSFTSR